MDLSAIEENGAYDGTRSSTIYSMTSTEWLCHVLRMDLVRKVFEFEPGGGSCRKGRPRQRSTKQVTEYVTMLGIRNWRRAATARDVWRRKLTEAKTCNRL